MDPQACLDALSEAVSEGNYYATREYAKVLERWLQQGGFMPDVSREQLVMFCQSVDMLAERMEKRNP
jgi:hypothetical protein